MNKTLALSQLFDDRNPNDVESVGSATGPWFVPEIPIASRSTRSPVKCLRPLGLSVFLAFTPLTAVADPWRYDATARTAHVITWPERKRRRLQLNEARILALQILEQAERARKDAVTAEYELARQLEIQE
ncbi:hypothetical protein [Rubinisphaera italica]|uniref:Uncharacterized protein n=1 Tax=Rubinisphaera italica TaxID=2527969 RepID=A0A5C5XKD5_9PLAN|nr:hypothetical protein [Rubinisphaera italica]TWT62999.1 hypothetical protein Pan54_37500 [Rubinisphaera italica]